jgi:hypothetical protein
MRPRLVKEKSILCLPNGEILNKIKIQKHFK